MCQDDCSGNGQCVAGGGLTSTAALLAAAVPPRCACFPGFTGTACEIALDTDNWWNGGGGRTQLGDTERPPPPGTVEELRGGDDGDMWYNRGVFGSIYGVVAIGAGTVIGVLIVGVVGWNFLLRRRNHLHRAAMNADTARDETHHSGQGEAEEKVHEGEEETQ